MRRNVISLFLTLLLVAALAALAQSPTSSNPGGSETKDPYGATLDHPNPGAAQGATGQPYNTSNTNEGQTPATGKKTVTGTTTSEPSTPSTTPAPSTSTSTNPSPSDTSSSDLAGSTASSSSSLPRTASDLPLLAIIGLLALGGALTVRSIAKREV